jgi:purine-binding chemotaxis protein CheW
MAAATAAPPAARGGTYLVFTLAGDEYAASVAGVREIIGALPITRVPGLPPAVLGVVNLRGRIIPVVDLRVRFALDAVDHGERTCIIVVQSAGAEYGVVVDRVLEVATIGDDAIEDAPVFAADVDTEYLCGIARHGSRVRLLLDLPRVLAGQLLAALPAAAPAAGAPAAAPAADAPAAAAPVAAAPVAPASSAAAG